MRTRSVGRIRNRLRLSVRARFDRRGGVEIYAAEVQRLIDRLHVLWLYQFVCIREQFETILRIPSQIDGIEPPACAEHRHRRKLRNFGLLHSKRRRTSSGNISWAVARGQTEQAGEGQRTLHWAFGP